MPDVTASFASRSSGNWLEERRLARSSWLQEDPLRRFLCDSPEPHDWLYSTSSESEDSWVMYFCVQLHYIRKYILAALKDTFYSRSTHILMSNFIIFFLVINKCKYSLFIIELKLLTGNLSIFASGYLKLKPFFLFLEYKIAFVCFFFHSKAQIHFHDLKEWVTLHF